MALIAWHDRTLAEHVALTEQYAAQGFGFISLSVYGTTASPYYAAVMVQPSPAASQHPYPAVPGSQWQQTFDQEAKQGYGPSILTAMGPASSPVFAAVFEPQNPIPLTRTSLPQSLVGWQLQQINNSGLTGGPGAAGNLFLSVYNDGLHVTYRDGSGNIQDAWTTGGGNWQVQQLNNTGQTNGPSAAGDLFVSVYNNQQHFAYRDGTGTIQDAWYGTGGWQLQQINNGGRTGGPPATGGLFVSVYNNQQHFTYLSAGGAIQDAWYGSDGWHLQRINNDGMTLGPPAVGGLFVSVYNNQQHVSYLAQGGNVEDAFYDGSGWQLQQINNGGNFAGGMTDGPPAVGDLFVCVYNDQQHFVYRDGTGAIQDAFFDGSRWWLQQINNGGKTAGPPAARGLFVCVYENQQHFSYLDAGGTIHDALYGPNGWQLQQLNNTGQTNGPSAAGDLFSCVYNQQQHFSYLDGQGNIQDAFYGPYILTLAAVDAQAKSAGLILRWAAAYGDPGEPAYAGVWVPNTAQAMWNNDGVTDTADGYQARFNAETSAWCRPAFVTLNTAGQYLSVFVDNQIGAWWANHVLTPAQYQTAFDTWTQQGYVPVCVQAAGADPDTATFSAIFAPSQQLIPKSFTPNGPVANAQIEAVIKQWMQNFGVRHAALGIVHGTQLVYARGYTWAEPNWPLVQPYTCFRLASVSKTVTALAVYQLIQEGTLRLTDTVQEILRLSTPSGGAPVDPRFNQITIQQLLAHTSGLNTDAFSDGVSVAKAFPAGSLPVSAAMTDSYIASLKLITTPGATQVYSNCGYYLLGRVVGMLRGQALPIDAYQQYLFNPLSITRIRRAVSLLADQPPDEARYQNAELWVSPSQMSETQPIVPDLYGTVELEINEGAGGLSAAATDLARLIAILISQQDNPALTRQTLVSMLSAGAALNAQGFGRAGYGFDGVVSQPGGLFGAQKGGSMDSTATVLQFSGEWGFTMLWAGNGPNLVPMNPSWYPNFPQVMSIATNAQWGTADLFPLFDMPSL